VIQKIYNKQNDLATFFLILIQGLINIKFPKIYNFMPFFNVSGFKGLKHVKISASLLHFFFL